MGAALNALALLAFILTPSLRWCAARSISGAASGRDDNGRLPVWTVVFISTVQSPDLTEVSSIS